VSAIRISTAPGTWGVEPVVDPAQAPWPLVLDEVAAAGFDGIELGPYGYLPVDVDRLSSELSARGLRLSAGFVMEPLHDSAHTDRILDTTRHTCKLLSDAGAKVLVVIGSLVPERSATAGRPDAAPPLDGWNRTIFIRTVGAIIDIAARHGLTATLHPHAGTFVEFDDEIDSMLDQAGMQLGLCIDTGHCLYSGVDANALLQRHADRVSHVHFKDLHGELLHEALFNKLSFEQAVASGVFCSLGDGSVDLKAFADQLRRLGYDGWATYEQDRVAADHPHARSDAQRSLACLHNLGIHDRSEPPRNG